jgi:hypothetical protein
MTATGRLERAESALDIQVLGPFLVLHGGERVALPPSRKTRALLAYLAATGQPQRRERLCRLFWNVPDDPRGALRWSLSKLRQIVNVGGQDILTAGRSEVALDSGAVALDVRRVRALSHHDFASLDTARLEEAAGWFKGEFLEDLSLPRCPEYEAWRAAQVDEANLIRAGILRALIDRLAAEPARALPYAHALQAMDPDSKGVAAEVQALVGRAREEAGKAAVANAPPDADERRHATVLAIEIVSPLHAFASVAPDVALRHTDPLFELMLAIIERHGGVVGAAGNSGVTAVFGTSGEESHAVQACRVALAVKAAIEQQSEGNVRVRAGLDSGEVVVRRRRRGATERIEVTGAAARIATRLVHSLKRGLLAVTDRTHAAVSGGVEMAALARQDCPRFSRDEQVYEILSKQRDGS